MKSTFGYIWDIWSSGGPFIGDAGAPHGRVTVEPNWYLEASGSVVGNYSKGPVRSFQRAANNQIELEVPNIQTISVDASIESDAATCVITLLNQSAVWAPRGDVVGDPGFYSWGHGGTPEAASRWGQSPNQWRNILVPNALLRTYEGFGGRDKSIGQALSDGNIVLTGLWLVDEVTTATDGILTLRCRNMAKLLLEQIAFPPLVPESEYPVSRCRWHYEEYVIPGTPETDSTGDQLSEYGTCTGLGSANSASDVWYGPNGSVHGHRASHAFDGTPDSYWYSVGNGEPTLPFALEWIEICCGGQDVNSVYIHPWAGNYDCYISVFEGGGWVDGSGGQTIPYDAAGVGLYTGANTANIPWVAKVGIPWEEGHDHMLPRTFQAQKIRLSFTNLQYSPNGPYHYRAGVRECRARLRFNVPGRPEEHGTTKGEGNYNDYSQIVRDFLLWSGFWLRDAYSGGGPAVYGNIEDTGIYADDCINDDVFDKKPIMDIITTFKEIVGYLFWVDDEGAARFESPAWWGPGNFLNNGQHTLFIPDIDEMNVLTGYTVAYRDRGVVSEIIISSERPVEGSFESTVTTRLIPSSSALLRGIVRPFGWVNKLFQNADEQRILAELVALHIFFHLRQGSITAVANTNIGINDQVRIWDRVSSETYIHYVRGVSRRMDLKTGDYSMTLTTHWLGDGDEWAVRGDAPSSGSNEYFRYSPRLAEFLRRSQARSVVTSRLNRPGSGTVVSRT